MTIIVKTADVPDVSGSRRPAAGLRPTADSGRPDRAYPSLDARP